MDGVIIDNTKNKIKFARKLGFDLKPEETPADFIETIMPPDALHELRQFLYYNPDTALGADLIEGAEAGLAQIKESQIPYFLISRRKDGAIAKKLLQKRGLWPSFFNEQNAFFVNEPEDKDLKAIELGVNIYVDDQPSVLGKLLSVKKRFLFDRFGKFGDLPFEHVKIASWKELLSHLI